MNDAMTDAEYTRLYPEFVRFARKNAYRLEVSPEYFEAEMWFVAVKNPNNIRKQDAYQVALYCAKYVRTYVLRDMEREKLKEDENLFDSSANFKPTNPPADPQTGTSLLALLSRWARGLDFSLQISMDILAEGESEVTSKLASFLLSLDKQECECALSVLAKIPRRKWGDSGKPVGVQRRMYRKMKSILKAG